VQILWRVLGQRPDLGHWEKQPFAPGVEAGPGSSDRRDSYEREAGRESPGQPEPDGPYRRAAQAILAFRIFPSHLATGVLRREPVEVGDTVGICFHAAPGVDLFFAARVVRRFDEPADGIWRAGFTYRTLVGHPEVGEETFCVEKEEAIGRVVVALRSWSRPGIFLARALAPLVRRWQVKASAAAAEHLVASARGSKEGILDNRPPA
jgi:uncharacterized protein (UPF0548 family)